MSAAFQDTDMAFILVFNERWLRILNHFVVLNVFWPFNKGEVIFPVAWSAHKNRYVTIR